MTDQVSVSKKAWWAGWVISGLLAAFFLMGVVMSFAKPPTVLEGLKKMGFDDSLAVPLGIVELVCTVLYLIPRTAVLGAILLTAYLGGAVCTHVRVGESFIMPVVFGVLVWGGIFLRDRRVRDLIPLRK